MDRIFLKIALKYEVEEVSNYKPGLEGGGWY
jgi:hypothetical protein